VIARWIIAGALVTSLTGATLFGCGSNGSGGAGPESDASGDADAASQDSSTADSTMGVDATADVVEMPDAADTGTVVTMDSATDGPADAAQEAIADSGAADTSVADTGVTDTGVADAVEEPAVGALVFRGAFVGGGAPPASNQNVKLNGVFVWHGAVGGQNGGVKLVGWLH
jgi:hypothetical protein